LFGQPQPPAQIDSIRDGGDEVVGTLLHLKAVLVQRREHAAQPRPGLEEHRPAGRVQLDQPMHSRQAGDPAADYHDTSRCVCRLGHRKTRFVSRGAAIENSPGREPWVEGSIGDFEPR